MKKLLIACSLLLFSCTYTPHPVEVVNTQNIKATWLKKGEPAPYNGILLTEEAYKGLRLKIIQLQKELDQCLQQQ